VVVFFNNIPLIEQKNTSASPFKRVPGNFNILVGDSVMGINDD